MTSKINVIAVVVDHCRTLRDFSSKSVSRWDYFVFFALPAIAATILTASGFEFEKDTVGALLAAFSVFAALLFNMLVILFDIKLKFVEKESDEKLGDKTVSEEIKMFTQEIYHNISFLILESFVLVMLLGVESALLSTERNTFVDMLVGFGIYFLLGNFILTVLMVIKRFHVLYQTKLFR